MKKPEGTFLLLPKSFFLEKLTSGRAQTHGIKRARVEVVEVIQRDFSNAVAASHGGGRYHHQDEGTGFHQSIRDVIAAGLLPFSFSRQRCRHLEFASNYIQDSRSSKPR